jgi:predicted transcriptional regulator of viral defense system
VYVGWSRWKLSKMPAILQTEQAERIRMLAQSHDSITIERLSQLASVSPEETTAVVQALVEHGRLKASLDAIAGVIRRR